MSLRNEDRMGQRAKASRFRLAFKKKPVSGYRKYARKKLGMRLMPADVALRNLVDIAAIFESRNSPYSLAAGTLLGAVRSGDFIKHDPDTDLTAPADNFDPRVLIDLCDEGFQITRCLGLPEDGMEITLARDGVKTDIFFLYPRGNGTYFSCYADFREGTASWIDYTFPTFEYSWITFKAHRFLAPATPEVFLEYFYGASWRTPVKQWNYAIDPPNAVPRSDRLNLAESQKAISEFIHQQTGKRLI